MILAVSSFTDLYVPQFFEDVTITSLKKTNEAMGFRSSHKFKHSSINKSIYTFTLFSSLNKCFIFCLVLLYSHCI